ncbi:RHS repeat protein, partial [Pseudomonas aeruginosa]
MFTLFFAQGANAEIYQWKIDMGGRPTAFFPSYAAACQYYFDNTSKNWLKEIHRVNPKWVQCSVSGTGGITWQTSEASLIGNSCPLGAELNNETGSCDCRPGYEMDDAGCKLPDKNGP